MKKPTPLQAGLARHLAATTPLPAASAQLVLQHCDNKLQGLGYLEDFEQVLLLRVAKYPPVPAPDRREMLD